jgi:hypothetical protein
MTSLAEFARRKEEFKRQLLRRIGYTEGLFDLFRFVELIVQLEPALPLPQKALTKLAQQVGGEKQLSAKYATGILDVLRALRLLEAVGPRLSLAIKGRALYALRQMEEEDALRCLLFTTVVETDGDYTLNLFGLIRQGATDDTFFERILELLEVRRQELKIAVNDRFILEVGIGALDAMRDSILKIRGTPRASESTFRERIEAAQRSKRRGSSATASSQRSTGEATQTVRHTVAPRRGWLESLGLLKEEPSAGLLPTDAGRRLWAALDTGGFTVGQTVRVPFDEELTVPLGLTNLPSAPGDRLFELASLAYCGASLTSNLTVDEFMELGRKIHDWTRLKHFNQSHGECIYLPMASILSTQGRFLSRSEFTEVTERASADHPDRVYRLSHRRGGLGYMVFR